MRAKLSLLLLIGLFASPPAPAADLPLLRHFTGDEFDGAWGAVALVTAAAGNLLDLDFAEHHVGPMVSTTEASAVANDGENAAASTMSTESAVMTPPNTIVYLAQGNCGSFAMGSGANTFTVSWAGATASDADYEVLPDPNDPAVQFGMAQGLVSIMHTDSTANVVGTSSGFAVGGVTTADGLGFVVAALSTNGVVQLQATFNGQPVFTQTLTDGANAMFAFEFPVAVGTGVNHFCNSGSGATFTNGGADGAAITSSVNASFKVRALNSQQIATARPRLWGLIGGDPGHTALDLLWEEPETGGDDP